MPVAAPPFVLNGEKMIGKNCYLRDGKICAEREQVGEQIDVDIFGIEYHELCPCCRGCGQTPYGEPVTDGEVESIIQNKIGDLEPCRECDGDGTLPEGREGGTLHWAEIRTHNYFKYAH